MIDKIINVSILNKPIIGLFLIGLIVWGSYSMTQISIDAVPDITNNQVQVITLAPTLAAQEAERFITAPIELAIANIPDVIEIRSISRFGISVITIVFKDEVDIYKARQLVGERLKEAENLIPEGLGTPELAPVSSGLGEIYHYIIRTKPGYENKYSPMDLRTIQDWIVKRQLSGTPGLAEVSGWGGYLKQYEIAIDPETLNSMHVSFAEIFQALEKNNENTGGAYIEKGNNAYFIRSAGLVSSLDDIEKIVIKNVNGIPLLIRDVAKVQYGSAIRYGAVTRNGKGEVVAGIALMLKGANSSEVIKNVKERIENIQKTLPDGVVIEPFIDRTKLVDKAIGTVATNLIEGGLIVVFILVLLIGNIRAGLIVASVIPLSMLFAFGMMNVFGVSGNLMSLGAIDFGLIVDGAVIIVENILHRVSVSLHFYKGTKTLSQDQMDKEVGESAKRMMSSASFGQIIILIVYLPILTLVGIEGKMFRPMAETVSFAILGAFLLSLTYVPMISSLFLSKTTEHKKNISDKIMDFFHRWYEPSLKSALRKKKTVVVLAFLMFAGSLFVFTRLGGEFMPTLEEGDFVAETALMQGSSLSQTIQTVTQAENILKNKFPEIEQVVTRIGSSEIPTDPMPLERSDMMIVLKDKDQWTSARSREELQEQMEEVLSVIPGVVFEMSQPIQMRFNELMTGIRQDVAVKIYGEDLDVLAEEAGEVAKLIASIEGVETPIVEKISGLPQITVMYHRDKIAQYGLTISDVNKIIKTAFAGEVAGVVFEGEKRFDMVVRLDKDFRQNLSDVSELYISLPSGNKVPLAQVADIQLKEGPAQISRDDTKRRIFVGFNVHGRDVESVVEEIQKKLDMELKLPPGYYITYGGQFQNLIEAKKRLMIALPTALLFIFILLFFAFKSVKQSLLIYTAIPLSAIGGVFGLWIRNMPFSISAGVGFIALFGVAVLNGIVLISYFNQLEKEGVMDITERVMKGARVRLRPVIMTAAVASLGFLPMAISTSAGGEVQKPLATVVIGGLISATVLTLIVLPVLYILFSKKKMKPESGSMVVPIVIGFSLLIYSSSLNAQVDKTGPLTLDDAVRIALQSNPELSSASYGVRLQRALRMSAWDFGKTELFKEVEEKKPSERGNIKTGIRQKFEFPSSYIFRDNVLKNELVLNEKSYAITRLQIIRDVKIAYFQLLTNIKKLELLRFQDSLYLNFIKAAELRYNTGESSFLEKLSAESKYQEIQIIKKQGEAAVKTAELDLLQAMGIQTPVELADHNLKALEPEPITDTTAQSPVIAYFSQKIDVAKSQLQLEKSKFLPDLSIGYFKQRLGDNAGFYGYEIGVGIPLWFLPQFGQHQAAKLQIKMAESDFEKNKNNIRSKCLKLKTDFENSRTLLDYYESKVLPQADEILKAAEKSYRSGDIGYLEYIQSLTLVVGIKTQYLDSVNFYNQTIINRNYLEGRE